MADSLTDIIENAARVESYLAGIDRDAFASSGLVCDAIERCMERVCKAAHRLGPHAAELMPDQPGGDLERGAPRCPDSAVDARRALAKPQASNQTKDFSQKGVSSAEPTPTG